MAVRKRAYSSGGRPAGGGRAGVPPSDKGTLDAPRRKQVVNSPMPSPGDVFGGGVVAARRRRAAEIANPPQSRRMPAPKPDAPGSASTKDYERQRAGALPKYIPSNDPDSPEARANRARANDPRYRIFAKKGGAVKPVGQHMMPGGHMMADKDMPKKKMTMKHGGSVKKKKAC